LGYWLMRSDWIARGCMLCGKDSSLNSGISSPTSVRTIDEYQGSIDFARTSRRVLAPLVLICLWFIVSLVGVSHGQEASRPGPTDLRFIVTDTLSDDTPTDLAEASPLGTTSAEQQFNAAASENRSYYVEPRSVGTRRETEPPRFVHNLGDIDWLGRPEETWLDVGLDYRM